MPPRLERAASCVRWAAGALLLVAAGLLQAAGASAQTLAPRPSPREQRDQADRDQIERTHREEGEAILALADAAMSGKPVPADFAITWHNDFVKAQRGTFVPFTLSVDAAALARPSALVYVRAIRRDEDARRTIRTRSDERDAAPYPVDAIFPVELTVVTGAPARISRGFAVEPGQYDVVVVMRERVLPGGSRTQVRASVLKQPLAIPDFPPGELAASTVIVGDQMTTLAEAVPADQLAERPYAIGRSEISPSIDRRFRRGGELIVVLLVYHPMVTGERQFDLKVEYHFFRRSGAGSPAGGGGAGQARAGEQYFNRTDPQRFTPALMGAFDPRSGEPVMAGQVVPLGGFEEGEYRLDVQVLDLLSGKSISRDVVFTVGS
jgi:hypothetical protein